MKCKVCGAESGQYVLCRACNEKKKTGEVIKCPECNEWHYKNESCKNNTSQVIGHYAIRAEGFILIIHILYVFPVIVFSVSLVYIVLKCL